MPSISQLEYALAVDKIKHFGRAAEACLVTQPTLSMQLHKLEEELGCVLFDRSKKPILTTDVGKKILDQAKVVLHEFKKIEVLSEQETSGELRGHFKLAVIPTLSPYLIPLFLRSFSEKYPKVELEIFEYQTEKIVEMLEEDELDAGLMATPLYLKHLQEDILCYEPFYLYVNGKEKLAKKNKLTEQDLVDEDIWLLAEGHCLRAQALSVCAISKKRKSGGNISFESGNLETLKKLVEQEGGSTVLPYLAGLDARKSDRAVLCEFQKPIPSREVSLVYRRVDLKEGILNALFQCIFKSLPEELRKLRKKHLEVVDI